MLKKKQGKKEDGRKEEKGDCSFVAVEEEVREKKRRDRARGKKVAALLHALEEKRGKRERKVFLKTC